jgi:predicted AAA+ superfamily ATPase
MLCRDKPYVNFENPDIQFEAELNPRKFLSNYKDGAVFDEIQRVPILFRYLQQILDETKQRGQYILTGSNNFLMNEGLSQSLAGRVGYVSLLPLSFAELDHKGYASKTITDHILKGGYPEIWSEGISTSTWMQSYVQTYLQRDIRLLKNISNLAAFNRFLFLCAHYAGQIINRNELAKDTGVDNKTILSWLNLLEESYIIYQMQPWFNNLNKRVIKSPKLYFYDTGLLCYLLGIFSKKLLAENPRYGSIVENWTISEIKKNKLNNGEPDGMYFFRDSTGNEIDLLLEKNGTTIAIEIKAASKFTTAMLSGIKYWQKYQPGTQCIVLYGGSKTQFIDDQTSIVSWKDVKDI